MTKSNRKTLKSVDELVDGWTSASGSNQHLSVIRDLVRFLSLELYGQYEPFAAMAPPFWERLAGWLQNVGSTKDRQCLLEFVPWLLFIGQEEMKTMYQAAFAGPIRRWIINEAQLDITATDLSEQLAVEVRQTFFGSIAGMQIDSFARINGLGGQSLRPNFRDLSRAGDFDRFKHDEIQGLGYQRIVAVEDMVGTGTQMMEAAPILAHMTPLKVLLCPIVVAPAGVDRWLDELKPFPEYAHFSFEPLFVIPANATLPMKRGRQPEPVEVREFRALLKQTWPQVQGTHPSSQLYSEFGFGNFGSLVLSYLNCPDNVPPLVHYEGDQWQPLFPRVPREGG